MLDQLGKATREALQGGAGPSTTAGKGPAYAPEASRHRRNSADPAALLPPQLQAVLLDGDLDLVLVDLRKLHGDQLRAAFDFLRQRRGLPFAEQASMALFPNEMISDFLGIAGLLEPDTTCAPASEANEHVLAFVGIKLALQVESAIRDRTDRVLPPGSLGPERAGPYLLTPHTYERKVVFWTASHEQRGQEEWVIGPDSISDFERDVDLYLGVAANALPGATAVPGSTSDGADTPRTPASLVEDEARGNAPWQRLAQLADDTNGGTALLSAFNGASRMANYELPARQLAAKLYGDVESGKIGHTEARDLAVEGRNDLMRDTRRKVSPAAAKASRLLKADSGIAIAEMQRRKTGELLKNYAGRDKRGRALDPRAAQAMQELLDADSDLWAHYAQAVDADPAMFKDALRDLGESPEVSKAIIKSAGRPNRLITGMAALQTVGGATGFVLGAIDTYQEIMDADEARRLHAAASALAGFTGGVVGAEAAVWVASALVGAATGGVGAPVMIVVSLLAGAAGGMIGAQAGMSLVELLASASVGGLVPGHSMAAAGGMSGAYNRGEPQGVNIGQTAATAIFKLDAQIGRLDRAIPGAMSRKELQGLQRRRLELLEERGTMEDLLTAVRVGAFEANESRLPEPESSPPPPPPMPVADECPDNDCDDEIW